MSDKNARGPLKEQALALLTQRHISIGTILDVGVLHGTPELMKAFPTAKHLLFEPVSEFAERIGQNYHGFDHELHQVAVGAEDGEVVLQVFGHLEGMSISHSRMDLSGDTKTASRVVNKVCLDTFLEGKNYPEPYFLKIDIDGHEIEVLKGAKKTLSKTAVVMIECAGSTLPSRISTVLSAGFKIYDLVEPCYYDGAFWQCDALFLREDLHQRFFKQLTGKVEAGLYQMFRG